MSFALSNIRGLTACLIQVFHYHPGLGSLGAFDDHLTRVDAMSRLRLRLWLVDVNLGTALVPDSITCILSELATVSLLLLGRVCLLPCVRFALPDVQACPLLALLLLFKALSQV